MFIAKCAALTTSTESVAGAFLVSKVKKRAGATQVHVQISPQCESLCTGVSQSKCFLHHAMHGMHSSLSVQS